ncbi:MAG: sulfite exporter TauE/SafE family protein [Geminicoccaceae bacterium]|nr:MAG: sulfite exporter TauE/SafE family protein [Geminicoccaceae bacterium]
MGCCKEHERDLRGGEGKGALGPLRNPRAVASATATSGFEATAALLQDWWFYATAIPAVFAFGLSKGGLGGGAGLLAVPLMALAMSPAQAVAVMLPTIMVMDLMGLWAYRRDVDRQAFWAMLPGALVGIALAALVFKVMSDDLVRLAIGLIAIAFCLYRWLGQPSAGRPHAVFGAFWGGLAGFTSTIAHAGGPPASIYLLSLKPTPAAFVGTMVFLFAAVNVSKVLPYALLGLFTHETLLAALVLVPVAIAGMGLGIFVLRRFEPTLFFRVVYVLVFLTGCKLIWDGSRGLWT